MNNISVVIISFNAEKTIRPVLQAASCLSEDIVVVDNGSTDQTKAICKEYQANFYHMDWRGYGAQKNYANSLAKSEWIISIDADEVMSEKLINELKTQSLDMNFVYSIPFVNSYCGKLIKFGRWQNERHVRLFPRSKVNWNEEAVHEGLSYDGMGVYLLKHNIIHYSMASKSEHIAKAKLYAQMGAQRMHAQQKKAGLIKRFINPVFRFVMDYLVFFGFLDGKLGFQIACITAKETYWKYKYLKNME